MEEKKVKNIFKNQEKEKRKNDFHNRLAESINRTEKYRWIKKV